MCLYPKLIKNPKYKETKKNGGNIPAVSDKRVMAVPIGCNRCAECLKKKSNDWRVRLFEDVKKHKNGHFVTLTFSNESIAEITKLLIKEGFEKKGYELDNAIATKATRLFLERWRKKHKKSVRHWLVTELGHNGTENIHMHGIIWTDEDQNEIKKHWQYGYVWAGNGSRTYVNEQTVNYITKYITKQDAKHRYYTPKILTSKGIGSEYTKSLNALNNTYRGEKTKDYYITKSGHKIALPIYYRNKIYNDEEREKLWLSKLDKELRFVDGIKIPVNNGQDEYIKIRNYTRKKYIQLGFNGERDYKEEKYEHDRRVLLQNIRINEIKEEVKDEGMGKYQDLSKWK